MWRHSLLDLYPVIPDPFGNLIRPFGRARGEPLGGGAPRSAQPPELEGKPAGFDEEIFDLLFSSADLHNFAEEDKIKYQNDMTTERDIQNQIDFAMDKGREEGFEKGIEKGIEKERTRNQRFIEVLKSKGVPKELIDQALSES